MSEYTTFEAAQRLGIQRRSVVALIRRRLLHARKRGRDYFIAVEEVERYARERRPAHRPPVQRDEVDDKH